LERVAAAVGLLNGARIEFEAVADVPDGGVLFGLPALLLYGLLDKSREIFSMPEGFYGLESIFVLMALMGLARIPSRCQDIEQLKTQRKAVPKYILVKEPARARSLSTVARREKALARHHQAHCLSGRNSSSRACPGPNAPPR
jgi:hypothetical protein